MAVSVDEAMAVRLWSPAWFGLVWFEKNSVCFGLGLDLRLLGDK